MTGNMTKCDVIEAIVENQKKNRKPIKRIHISAIVECVFDVFIEQLVKEGRIEIRDFGMFKVKITPE